MGGLLRGLEQGRFAAFGVFPRLLKLGAVHVVISLSYVFYDNKIDGILRNSGDVR